LKLSKGSFYKNAAKPSTAAPTAPRPWAASLSPAAGVEVAEAALALALVLVEPEPLAVVEAEADPEPVVVALPVAAAVPLLLPEVLEHPAEAGWRVERERKG
jgi:hypothetical protein